MRILLSRSLRRSVQPIPSGYTRALAALPAILKHILRSCFRAARARAVEHALRPSGWKMARVPGMSANRSRGFFAIFPIILLFLCGCTPYGQSAVKEAPPLPTAKIMKQMDRPASPLLQHRERCLTLERAIDEALRASPEMEEISQRIGAAKEQVKQADALFYPSVSASEDYTDTDNIVYGLMNTINQRNFDIARASSIRSINDLTTMQNFSSQIQGEWVLYHGGTRFQGRKAAIANRYAREEELKAERNQLVARVTETYFNWLKAIMFISVAKRALKAAETDERMGEAGLKAHTVLESDVLRLRVRTAAARDRLLSARIAARKLQAALECLLARDISPKEIPDLSQYSVSPAPTEPENTEALVKTALNRRPEMASIREMIASARAMVKSAKGGYLPRFGINASYEVDSENLWGGGDSWLFGAEATWPLFQGGITRAKVQEAQCRLEELKARGKQVALDIALEVQQAALGVQEATDKLVVARERKKWAEKSLHVVRSLYRNQHATLDTLLLAEVAWNKAEVSYTAAVFDTQIARALLKKSLGEFADGLMEAGRAGPAG